jgi:hypothetical protein
MARVILLPAPSLLSGSLARVVALQGDEALLGAVDSVEAGEVWGWACLRGAPAEGLQVTLRLTRHASLGMHPCRRPQISKAYMHT